MKLSTGDYADIRRSILSGEKEASLARRYGVSRQTINLVKKNRIGIGFGPDVSHLDRTHKREHRLQLVQDAIEQRKTPAEAAEEAGIRIEALYAFRRTHMKGARFQARSRQRSRRIGGRKLDFRRANAMRDDYRSGYTVRTLSKQYDVSVPTVYAVLSNRIWNSEYTRE